jgi:formylglycine-generating enzyme required for sulfatase activity/energy-coupling factor transporter ATP-binding protein EcfA2
MPKNKEFNIEQVDPQRDAILGDQYNLFITTMGAFTPPPDLVQLRRDYLAHIERAHHALDFKGIPQLRSLPSELALEEVYVPLLARPELPEGDTWERRLAGRNFEREALPEGALQSLEHTGTASAPVQIEAALREKNRVVILGDPGSGKSTLLKHLALRLAKETAAPLPILLPLNAYARALAQKDLNLQNYLVEYFAGRAEGVAALGPLFKEALGSGKAVILLDGLDEVQSNRAALVEKVQAFSHEALKRGNRVLVTSRIVGYRDAPLEPKDWALYTLLDFTPEAIETFARQWCLSFEKSTLGDTPEARKQAEAERAGLLDAIAANPGVERLASNPLLLTILALIKRQGVELPKSRIKLYDRYLETLIEAWNRASALDKSAGRESLDYESTLEVLGPLALRLREENPTYGLVGARQLQDWLTEHYTGAQWEMKPGPAREKAREFLDSVRKYSNLLLERGEGQYGFIHLTFEEALAAYGLVAAGQVDRQKSLAYIQKYLSDPAWRETILLAVGVLGLIQRTPQAAGEMVRAMLKMDCDGENPCGNVLLAGACLEDVGAIGLGQAAARDVQTALLAASQNRALPPAVQRYAGFSLARTGWLPADPSTGGSGHDLDAWVNIPAGEFLYGDEKRKEIIKIPFAIQKYLVTNLQFRRFVDDKGYECQEFWSAEGWAWRTGHWDTKAPKEYKNWLDRRPPEKRCEPYFWHDEKWNNPLAPLVGVSWFEAEAYANWLSKQLGQLVRLPSEQEWERAARGMKGREYAWGDEFDRVRLNCAEFWGEDNKLDWSKWLGSNSYSMASTTLVGQFPVGNTPEGISDLSGNVWEWTNSWYEKEQVNRVVRGGSWRGDSGNARCAYRDWRVPGLFNDNFGFRVVSPGL